MVGESDRVLQHHLIAMLQGNSYTLSDQESGRSSGTSHHQQSSYTGYQSRQLGITQSSELMATSIEQGERLLQSLIERKIQQHLHEVHSASSVCSLFTAVL